MTANYAINPTPELYLRSNQTLLPARVIAALDPMNTLSAAPSDSEIFVVIDAWLADLADENYRGALERTDLDPYYSWTPELLKAVIEGYGLPEPIPDGRKFRVTDSQNCIGGKGIRKIERGVSPSLANVSVQLPLNGEWSDLTATFRVEERAKGSVLILEEVHVF